MKRKLIGVIAVFALSLLIGSSVKAIEVFTNADVALPTVTITCSKECTGDTGGKCWQQDAKGGCKRSEHATNFCKCG